MIGLFQVLVQSKKGGEQDAALFYYCPCMYPMCVKAKMHIKMERQHQ